MRIPALFTRTLSWPKRSKALCMKAATSASCSTCVSTNTAWPPLASISAATRWPRSTSRSAKDGVQCPSCESQHVIKRGFDDTEPARQRYECHDCNKRFDDLTDTIFAGHHQPLKVWVLCLYFMGLNVSNEQIAHELSINESDAYQMTTELRGGIVKKSQP